MTMGQPDYISMESFLCFELWAGCTVWTGGGWHSHQGCFGSRLTWEPELRWASFHSWIYARDIKIERKWIHLSTTINTCLVLCPSVGHVSLVSSPPLPGCCRFQPGLSICDTCVITHLVLVGEKQLQHNQHICWCMMSWKISSAVWASTNLF